MVVLRDALAVRSEFLRENRPVAGAAQPRIRITCAFTAGQVLVLALRGLEAPARPARHRLRQAPGAAARGGALDAGAPLGWACPRAPSVGAASSPGSIAALHGFGQSQPHATGHVQGRSRGPNPPLLVQPTRLHSSPRPTSWPSVPSFFRRASSARGSRSCAAPREGDEQIVCRTWDSGAA